MAKQLNEKTAKAAKERRKRPLATPTDLSSAATRDISAALNQVLADVFALYLKTKISTGTSAARTSATITCCWTSRATSCSP